MSTVTHTHTHAAARLCIKKRQLQVTLHLKKGWKSPDESTCNPPVHHHHHRRVFGGFCTFEGKHAEAHEPESCAHHFFLLTYLFQLVGEIISETYLVVGERCISWIWMRSSL